MSGTSCPRMEHEQKPKKARKPKRLKNDLRSVWLEAYIALCQTKSYSRAANKIGVTQTDVTRYMVGLTVWSRKILISSSNPLELTDDGRNFLKSAQTLLPAINALRAELPKTEAPAPAEKKSAKDIRVP